METVIENAVLKKRQLRENLEDRLIHFSILILKLSEDLPNTKAGSHICGQMVRCGTSPAFNYGEAQSAESRADFIHKMKVCLKELRETLVCLKIIYSKPLVQNLDKVTVNMKECNELISIFVKSINTATSNK
jgi:four helix bundle protein